jgi:hypothetical protein
MNRCFRSADSTQAHATFRVDGRSLFPQQRTAVVGNGNNDVGSATPNRKYGRQVAENSSGRDPGSSFAETGRHEEAPGHPASLCGEMSQQGGEFRGNISAPQKLLHLVGCREPKAEPGLEGRRYSNPFKR